MDENSLLIMIIVLLVLLLIVVLTAATKARPNKDGKGTGEGIPKAGGPGTERSKIKVSGGGSAAGPAGGPAVGPDIPREKIPKEKKVNRRTPVEDPQHVIVKIFVDRGRSGLVICPNCDAENMRGESTCISCDYPL